MSAWLGDRLELLNQLQERLRIVDPGNDALASEGTVSGDLHQSWMKFRSVFQDDNKAALAEVERGESHLIQEYQDALDNVGADSRTIIQSIAGVHFPIFQKLWSLEGGGAMH